MVAIHEPLNNQPVQVTVRPSTKPIVLALTSYRAAEWRIDAPAEARLESIVVSGFYPQTIREADVPIHDLGTSGFCRHAASWEETDYDWMSRAVEAVTNLATRTFQGCSRGHTFLVPHTYCPQAPVDMAVPGDDRTDPRNTDIGCSKIQESSHYCIYSGQPDTGYPRSGLVSLETGDVCGFDGFNLKAQTGKGLLWRGETYFACTSSGLVRGSLIDGSTEVLRLDCKDIEEEGGQFYVRTGSNSPWHGWFVYDSFEAIREGHGRPQEQIDFDNLASLYALREGTMYGTWHATDRLVRMNASTGVFLPPVELEDYDGWIHSLSITSDERVVFSTPEGIRVHDLATGKLVRNIDDYKLRSAALDCIGPR